VRVESGISWHLHSLTTVETYGGMKRNLILLSSTMLLLNTPAFGVSNTDPAAQKTDQAKPAAGTIWAKKGKMVIPPPPKETLPGHNIPSLGKVVETKPEVVTPASESNVVTLGSASYVSKNDRVQRFVDYVDVKSGMETAPLTLAITNDGFKWWRLLIANQVVATEKSLSGKASGTIDLTGIVQPGTNQLVVQAGGVPGSRLEWKVTTPASAKLDKIDPQEALVGDTVKISGKGFSPKPANDEVTFNKKKGVVLKATTTSMDVQVPKNADMDDNVVAANIKGLKTNTLRIKIRAIPELTGSNLQGVPPGQQLIIFGKNFSKNTGENQVFFGDTQASVVSGDTTQLVVVVPNLPYTVGHLPSEIRVQIGKFTSKNSISVQVGPQMYTEPGLDTSGKDVPVYVPGSGSY
jgi:hypothetical protein